MQLSALLTTLLACTASAHFVLNYPAAAGVFNEETESTSPCGGYNPPYFNTTSNVTAGQFAIAMLSTHPQAQYLIRATLNETAPYTWTNILPVINEQGIGDMCLDTLKAPAGFEGKTALIQVVQDAADGILYQCAAVNFVSGSNTTVGPTCVNATGVTASISTQTDLNSANGSTTSGTASGSASASASHSAANVAAQVGAASLVGSLFAAIALL